MLDTTFNPSLPVSIKLGDANLDGFPDFLIITGSGKDHIPSLVYSVPCTVGVVGCGKDGSGKRGWKVATKGVESLQAVKDARSLSFLDMDEDVSFYFLLILASNSFSLMGRERWISWSRGQGVRAMVISCSYRTTFTTTLSSSRPLVCIGASYR